MANQTPLSKGFFAVQFCLRASVVAFTLAAVVTTVTTRTSLEDYELIEEFDYRGSPPMRFQVGINAVVGSLCLGSLILLYNMKRSVSDPQNYFQLFLHDMAMAAVSMAGCAAVTGERYLAEYGEEINSLKIWAPYCSRVEKFCHTTLVALVLSYLAFLCLFILAVMAAHKLKNP